MTPNTTIRTVSLTAAGGAAPSARVWDIPYSMPVKDLSIFVSSQGVTLAAGGVTWNVYYGGTWSGGQPFASGSVLSNGVSQSNGTFGAAEVANIIYTETKLFPPNARLGQNPDFFGPAVSVGFVNGMAVAVDLTVYFVCRFAGRV